MITPVVTEPLLGYHPCSIGFLTSDHELVGGQCQVGSLTGAVASERVSEALKGSLRMVGNHSKSAKAEGSLTARTTVRAGTKVGLSDPVGIKWECHRSTDKSYPGDNRLITPKSSHRRSGLAPRGRLIASWGCSRSQGLGCSPIKAVRELGSERRETVRSLSGVGVGYLRGAVLSTRGPGWTGRWCICCIPNAWQSSQAGTG